MEGKYSKRRLVQRIALFTMFTHSHCVLKYPAEMFEGGAQCHCRVSQLR